jgi:hypothetical protein
MVHRYVQYNDHSLIIQVNFMINVCRGRGGFGSNAFVTKTQSFLMDGHYKIDVINGVGYLRLDSVVPLVLHTVAVQWLEYRHCTTCLSEQRQPCRKWVISRQIRQQPLTFS